MRRIWASAFALAGIVAACSSFDDADTPTGGPDGGTDAPAGPSDAASTNDAGDAGPDARRDAGHTFFDDFDDGPLGAKWTTKSLGGPITFELVNDAAAPSAPNAIRAEYPDNDGGYWSSYLLERFDKSVKSFTCRVMINVGKHSEMGAPSIMFVSMRLPPGNAFGDTSAELSVHGDESSLFISETNVGPSTGPGSGISITTNKWLPLELSVDVDAKSIDVKVDGKPHVSGAWPAAPRPNEGFDIRFGVFAVGTGDSARFLFDDFSCDVVFD